jgi:hypothetical protein
MIGPFLLLAPVALFALRTAHGRRLWLAALVFALPAFFNTGARFLLPALPFLALSIGIAFANSWGVLPMLTIFTAVACWPSVLSWYADPVAWRIRAIPVHPGANYVLEHVSDAAWAGPIARNCAPGERVFSFTTRAQAYLPHDIIVSYESALGNRLQDVLEAPIFHAPVVETRISFQPSPAQAVRIRQTAQAPAFWTVAELRVRGEGREVSVSPNPSEAPLAFDGNPATRWSTWENMTGRERIEIRFSRPETVDEVILEGPFDVSRVAVDLWSGTRWNSVAADVRQTRHDAPGGLRREATRYLKEQGIRCLLIDDSDSTAADMRQDPGAWGFTRLGHNHVTTLYRID